MTRQANAILFWLGRIVALLASFLFVALFIGEGVGEFTALRDIPTELLVFLPMLAIAIIGLILSFFRRRAGAIIMLAGGIVMFAFHLFRGGTSDLNTACMFGLPYLVCGVTSFLPYGESPDE